MRVWQREQRIVRQDGFRIVNIEIRASRRVCFQECSKCGVVNDQASTGVEQREVGFATLQPLCIDEVAIR